MMGNIYFRRQTDGYARDGFATSTSCTVEVEKRITVVRIVTRVEMRRRQFDIKSCSLEHKISRQFDFVVVEIVPAMI